ncbi:hypothetical protein [Bradyrhizobium sp. STM 3557]|uniref:hypothetical protein n=1 Tax=Bradyrhizobium sp. STM 3557 TaxID=578920 RepID=UPI003890D5E7
MRKERQNSTKVRPGIVDRFLLAISYSRTVDGLWIGSYRTPEYLSHVERALALLREQSPLHHSRVLRDLHRVWVYLLADGLASYNHSLRACVLDERFLADPETSIEQIASAIVHEATHARLERLGVGYAENQRARIEAVCFRRELSFAVRLPDGLKLQQNIEQYLGWYPAHPEYFQDDRVIERSNSGEVDMLRHVGTPDWVIRMMPVLKSIIGRARKLLLFRLS